MLTASDRVRQEWVEILSLYEEVRRGRIGEALRRLTENLRHLDGRYQDLKRASSEVQKWVPGDDTSHPLLDDLQHQLIDRIEAFHQQVYSTLSTLTLVLQRMRDPRTPMYPTDSMTKLLRRLKTDLSASPQCIDDISRLDESVTFRSKYVDHPASNPLYDWYTHGHKGETFLIFFKHPAPGSPLPEPPAPGEPNPFLLHPRDPHFRPVVGCAEFMVAPDEDATYAAIQRVVSAAIDHARLSVATNDGPPTPSAN
jgi:hypothetical protein